MHLTYSSALPHDADAIFAMSKHLIDCYEDLKSIGYDSVLTWVRRKIENHISEYVCVYLDSKKAGYYRFTPCDGMMELDDLYILPQFRNLGIGTEIIRRCCAETSLPVMLYVFTRNTGALALYQRLGFQITQTIGQSRCIMVRQPQEERV